jgi:hypothetical protein
MSATKYPEGTVLTCTHDCGCRIVIQRACQCESEAGATYTCACGTPMVVVSAAEVS